MSVSHSLTAHRCFSMLTAWAVALALCLAAPIKSHADDLGAPELREAKSAVLIDQGGNVLFALNPDEQMPPASITKVMTAMVALDAKPDLGHEIELVAPDLGDNSQMADYGTGDHVTIGDLVHTMLVYSANDAAWNVAVHTAGSEEAFVERMNQKAAQIGMTHTHFENSHGLESDNHLSTAMDLAIMCRYALENYPFIAHAAMDLEARSQVHGETYVFTATNKMLWTFPGMRGLKTGAVIDNYTFTGAAGRGNLQLYSAVLGCATFSGRFDDTASMMEWGFSHYGDMQLAHPEWRVRQATCAFNFSQRLAVVPTGPSVGKTWPTQGEVMGSGSLVSNGSLAEPGRLCGYTAWSQSSRPMASETYTAQTVSDGTSAWPTFTQPLFDPANAKV